MLVELRAERTLKHAKYTITVELVDRDLAHKILKAIARCVSSGDEAAEAFASLMLHEVDTVSDIVSATWDGKSSQEVEHGSVVFEGEYRW